MKTDKSEFISYEEFNEFFDNPLIREEIELTKENTRKEEWVNVIKFLLTEIIKTHNVRDFNISYEDGSEIRFDITYHIFLK